MTCNGRSCAALKLAWQLSPWIHIKGIDRIRFDSESIFCILYGRWTKFRCWLIFRSNRIEKRSLYLFLFFIENPAVHWGSFIKKLLVRELTFVIYICVKVFVLLLTYFKELSKSLSGPRLISYVLEVSGDSKR